MPIRENWYSIKKMKILNRYILKEISSAFIFGFIFFNFILFIGIIFDLTELIFIENVPLVDVGKLVIFKIPSFFDIVIPVSLLFASLLSFGRLSSEGEIIAMRSSGISLFHITGLLLLFAFSLTLGSLLFSFSLTPWCNQHYKKTYQKIIFQRPTIQVKERIITNLKERRLYTYHIDPKNYEMQEIVLYEFASDGNYIFPQITLARQGKFEEEILKLKKVTFYRFGNNYRIYRRGRFDSQIVYLTPQVPEKAAEKRAIGELSLWEIAQKLSSEKTKPKPDEEKIRKLAVDFHGRIAIPLATFLMGLIAVPLAIKIKRGEKSISLGISLIITVAYYVLFMAGRFLGRGGLLPPYLAMWLPNILLSAAGIWLSTRLTEV
ncbi:MAG: LptF/LptG family permease [Candidatus Aerophobus sp.]|nr:MAG: LptF/LptG family permease [Candidatus Aerophobus sp.]